MAIKEHISEIADQAERYAEAKLEEASLNTVEQSVNILSGLIAWLVVAGIGMLTLAGLSVVCFLLLSEALESNLGASLILFGSFAILFLILASNYKRLLVKPVKNFLLGQYLSTYKMKKHE